jgi:hypothetical protein
MAELRRAWDDSHVSGETYTELIDSYAAQEGTSRSIVHDEVLIYRPNPTPSVSVADLHRALTDDRVDHIEYMRLISRYAEQEHITRTEAYRRSHRYEAQDLSHPSTPQEPTLSTGWDLLDEMAGVDAPSQGNETQGLSTPTIMAGQAGTFESAPAVLDGGQHVEPTPQREGRGTIGRSAMDRLRGAIQRSEWQANYLNEWANTPREPLTRLNRGLSEQEVQRLREAVHRVETADANGTWFAVYDYARNLLVPGVRGDDPEQNTTTETE